MLLSIGLCFGSYSKVCEVGPPEGAQLAADDHAVVDLESHGLQHRPTRDTLRPRPVYEKDNITGSITASSLGVSYSQRRTELEYLAAAGAVTMALLRLQLKF